MKLIPLILLACLPARAIVWEATLPGGGVGTATLTSWGASVSYDDYPSAVSTSIVGRTSYTTTTRSASAPLTLSLLHGENWDWINALDNHWVSFTAVGLDGVSREAEFYNVANPGPTKMAMYSAAAASSVPEPATYGLIASAFLALWAAFRIKKG